jgi:hypothetical protein
MDALMRMMRQTHHDAMNTSMFDAEAYKIAPPMLDSLVYGQSF